MSSFHSKQSNQIQCHFSFIKIFLLVMRTLSTITGDRQPKKRIHLKAADSGLISAEVDSS